jgi:hypothetical protein
MIDKQINAHTAFNDIPIASVLSIKAPGMFKNFSIDKKGQTSLLDSSCPNLNITKQKQSMHKEALSNKNFLFSLRFFLCSSTYAFENNSIIKPKKPIKE